MPAMPIRMLLSPNRPFHWGKSEATTIPRPGLPLAAMVSDPDMPANAGFQPQYTRAAGSSPDLNVTSRHEFYVT
jgi:hypothetical protein